jgi:methionyl-tRNA formyltransferase
MKILLMCDGDVGEEIAVWLIKKYKNDIGVIVSIGENRIYEFAKSKEIPTIIFESETKLLILLEQLNLSFDLGILAWWPKIVKQPLLNLPEKGFINTHPSMLPHNRGKHYNFWALIEEAPFGC